MKAFYVTGLLFFIIAVNHANAQVSPVYYQSNYIRVVQPDVDEPSTQTVNYSDPKAKLDTLLNPFTGGLNNPTFFNVDFNGDSIQDLYIFDREAGENQFLLFQGAGKKSISYRYAPQYHYAFPQQASKWVEFADYNKDGLPDLFTSSYSCNTCVQVNKNTSYQDKSSGKYITQFKKVTDTLFYYDSIGSRTPIGIANSSNPQFIDVDKDGDLDILAWDLGFTSIQFFRNRGKGQDSLSFWFTKGCWGYFTEFLPHFYQNFSCELNSNHQPVHYDNTYDPDSAYKKLHSSGQHGAFSLCAFDVDCDGDIDLLLGDGFNDSLAFIENGNIVRGQKYNGNGFDTMINLHPTNQQYPIGAPCVIATMPTPSLVDINNDSLNDLVIAAGQPTGKDSFVTDRIHNIWYYYNSGNKPSSPNGASNNFDLVTKDFLQNTMIDWGINSAPCFIDVDNDGRKDLIVAVKDGGAVNGFSHLVLYLNKPGKTPGAKPYLLYNTDDYLGFSKLSKNINWPVPAAYLNSKDGKSDLLVGNDSGQVMYFKSEGSIGGNPANFHLSTSALKYISHPSGKLMPINVGGANSSPTAADINGDGKMDLIIGSNYGNICYYKCLGYLPGSDNVPYFDSVTISFGGLNATTSGEYQTAPCVADMDKDGKLDMLLGDEIGNLWYFHDFDTINPLIEKNKILVWDNGANKVDSNKTLSTYIIPAIADLDNDTFPDIILGCRRGGLIFLASANNGFESLRNSAAEAPIAPPKIGVVLFPNPAKNMVTLEYNNPEKQQNGTVVVTDILGRQVLLHSFELRNGKGDEPISTKEFANGIYIVALYSADQLVFSNKLIIEK